MAIPDRLKATDRLQFNHLTFPRLLGITPDLPTLNDLKKDRVDTNLSRRKRAAKKLSNANRRMDAALGAASEFRQVRHNLSYKPLLDTLGEDFPMHPEYLYVINIVLRYYGINVFALLEYIARKELYRKTDDISSLYGHSQKHMNINVQACLNMLMYLLYVQYQCNPAVLMDVFGISAQYLRQAVDEFMRSHENMLPIQTDYGIIYGRLIKLQPNYE